MEIVSVSKTPHDMSVVVLNVPDALLLKVTTTLNALGLAWSQGAVDTGEETPFEQASEAKSDFASTIDTIRRVSRLGSTMTAGRKKRTIELLGETRAGDLFGPNWGEGAWNLFQPADPMRLRKKADGSGWYNEPNPDHVPEFLAALLEIPGDPKELLEDARRAQSEDRPFMPVASPERMYEQIIEGSLRGRQMSDKQFRLIERTLQGAGKRMFPGSKDGSLQDFLKYYSKRKRDDRTKEWSDNPDYNEEAFAYAQAHMRA